MAITLPRGALLQIYGVDAIANGGNGSAKWNTVTDHNRGPFTVSHNRIQQTQRMSNGTLRKFFISDKQRMSLSWQMLPSYRTLTVDGAWGAEDLRAFYESNEGQGTFNIRVNMAKNGSSQESSGYEEYTVNIVSASFSIVKRGLQPFWNVSLSLEEI